MFTFLFFSSLIIVNDVLISGKAFCMLTREDFIKRAPHAGDLLYNTLVQYVNMSQLGKHKQNTLSVFTFRCIQTTCCKDF